MGNRDDLTLRPDKTHFLADASGDFAADVRVDFIEDNRVGAVVEGENALEREHHAGDFAGTCDIGERTRALAGIRLKHVTHLLATAGARLDFFERDIKLSLQKSEIAQLARYKARKFLAGRGAFLRKFCAGGLYRGESGALGLLKTGEFLFKTFYRVEPFAFRGENRHKRFDGVLGSFKIFPLQIVQSRKAQVQLLEFGGIGIYLRHGVRDGTRKFLNPDGRVLSFGGPVCGFPEIFFKALEFRLKRDKTFSDAVVSA